MLHTRGVFCSAVEAVEALTVVLAVASNKHERWPLDPSSCGNATLALGRGLIRRLAARPLR